MPRREPQLGDEGAARAVARRDARARVAVCSAFRLVAGKRNKAAVVARGGPGKTSLRRAMVPACVSAERHLQLNKPHAAAIVAVGIGSWHAGLEGLPLQWRNVIGDTFARKTRTEIETRLA